jgi:hypothetical protein
MVMLVMLYCAFPRSLLPLPLPSPPLNWQKEHYPVVVENDLIGLGVRRSSQVVVDWWC